ncbi:MAG: DUF1080 domain-containing protein [Planctomycetota bacterium]|nr:DUF1080 domain-containing protein [Planctomycetota bacterium]
MIRTIALLCAVAVALCGLVRAEDAAVDEPFNGKDLTGWKLRGDAAKSGWKVGKAALDPAEPKHLTCSEGGTEMVNVVKGHGQGVDIFSEQKFGDVHLELEVMVAKESNSGIYLLGEYEIQVLDSFGKENPSAGDMGGIYSAAAPKENACKAPGEWQKYVIDFVAPRFDAEGKKTAKAKFVKVVLNGKVIHENVEVEKPTGGELSAKEVPTGPLLFQGNHGPVAYRNIKITPVAAK